MCIIVGGGLPTRKKDTQILASSNLLNLWINFWVSFFWGEVFLGVSFLFTRASFLGVLFLMCGIAGFYSPSEDSGREIALAMASALSHRGPDGSGSFCDPQLGIYLSHTRLAILDLSNNGSQPMNSPSGRYIISYNGEIYNFKELKEALQKDGVLFKSETDTEVLLAMFERHGIEASLSYLNGMFAFALWDTKDKVLHLARDTIGIKPLYFGWQGRAFIFASELKAFTKHPAFLRELSLPAISLYLRYGYIPAPYSIYRGVYKLEPGTLLSLPYDSLKNRTTDMHSPIPYRTTVSVYARSQSSRRVISLEEAKERFKVIFDRSVKYRLVSDVPLGVFLSGGIDSSLIAAFMSRHTTPQTFSIGFEDPKYDEAPFAKSVSSILGTIHTERYVTAKECIETIPHLPFIYDEPFADSSQIPTLILSQLTREHVTVALSGDGGDELFYGYSRYPSSLALWNFTSRMPKIVSDGVALLGNILPRKALKALFSLLSPLFPSYASFHNREEKALKAFSLFQCKTYSEFYTEVLTQLDPKLYMSAVVSEPLSAITGKLRDLTFGTLLEYISLHDLISYLPDDLLVKVDRASMSVGLEARVPFLDLSLVEYSLSLPTPLKYERGVTKVLLKEVLREFLPEDLVSRPKAGFAVPLGKWLRGSLSDWLHTYLTPAKASKHGILNWERVNPLISEHLSQRWDHSQKLWALLTLHCWLDEHFPRGAL